MVSKDEAIIVAWSEVRSIHSGIEGYAFQYYQSSSAQGCSVNAIADMRDGGNNPNHLGLGHASAFHCNNLCRAGQAIVRVKCVGGRIINSFNLKALTFRANFDLARSLFIEYTQRLTERGYVLPPCLCDFLVIPLEFPYGTHVNSDAPRPSRVPVPMPVALPVPPEVVQLCKCLTLRDLRHR